MENQEKTLDEIKQLDEAKQALKQKPKLVKPIRNDEGLGSVELYIGEETFI